MMPDNNLVRIVQQTALKLDRGLARLRMEKPAVFEQ